MKSTEWISDLGSASVATDAGDMDLSHSERSLGKDRNLPPLWLTHASTNGVLWDKWLYEDDKGLRRTPYLQ